MQQKTTWKKRISAALAASLLLAACAHAQFAATPSPSPAATANPSPPHDIPLIEKKWDELSNQDVGEDGRIALAIKPERWKHAETENFVIHFRRVTEAHIVAREIEYDIWFVAKTLGATRQDYKKKSHVFVFEDEAEWQNFRSQTNAPQWSSSFASYDNLFLNIRNIDRGGQFDSHTLAHETTHAVVARLYPYEHWPVWLNEGFAEYMGGASVASRTHQPLKKFQSALSHAEMPLDEMFALKRYPEDRDKVDQLYQTGEKFVRFLMDELPPDRFRKFVTELLSTGDPKQSLMRVYGDKFKDFDGFEKKFAAFSK
jgi:hypothetical protein